MADPIAKAERAKIKDIRQGKGQKENLRSRSKKYKPYALFYMRRRPIFNYGKKWRKWNTYRNQDEILKAIKDINRKHPEIYFLKWEFLS